MKKLFATLLLAAGLVAACNTPASSPGAATIPPAASPIVSPEVSPGMTLEPSPSMEVLPSASASQ